jgi:type IV pilus assembly protein PilQ
MNPIPAVIVFGLLAHAAPLADGADGEARISMDFRDASIVDVVSLLSEVGGFQVVFHPGIDCRLTLKLRDVRWSSALDVALRSCGLGRDVETDDIVRVAPVARLRAEVSERRRYEEERALTGRRSVSAFRLSYARAAEMAPLVKKFLSPRGEVVYDSRTNTLIIID